MENGATKSLLNIIEAQLGWGNSELWHSRDFEKLNILIQGKTKISLSSSTLRRIWGKAEYANKPSYTTLDTLAQFAGYHDWNDYYRNQQKPVPHVHKAANKKKFKPLGLLIVTIVLIFGAVLSISFLLLKRITKAETNDYSFSSRPVTHDLPNTVVFTYNARSAPDDSVFIQQTWDGTKKVNVKKNDHLFNAIYYKPGFYHAKLSVGKSVVKEYPLLIPTSGWPWPYKP